MDQARFDILRNTEYGTYHWKLQLPDFGYICQSTNSTFSTFRACASDARHFRKLMGIKAIVSRTGDPYVRSSDFRRIDQGS
jgi:hypothetical protein